MLQLKHRHHHPSLRAPTTRRRGLPRIKLRRRMRRRDTHLASKAPVLLYCPELAGNITACQRGWGKKVTLSIGGSTSNIKFTSEKQAKNFGTVLLNLFGPPGNVDVELRPFGMMEVDGFDIGNPNPLSSPFLEFWMLALMMAKRQRRQLPRTLPNRRHNAPLPLSLRHENLLPLLSTTMSFPILRPFAYASSVRFRL